MPNSEKLLQIIAIQAAVAELGLDLGGVMGHAVARTLDLVGADGAVIELAEGAELVYRAASGTLSAQLGVRVRRNGSLSGNCLVAGHSLVCEETEADPRVDLAACRRTGIRSMVAVPLMHAGDAVGVLKAASARPGAFSDDDAQALDLLSKMLGAAMHWATRYGKDDLFFRATHDDLTGLANRALFMDRLRLAASQVTRQATSIAVLAVDMDGLKQINDVHGHAAGDAALVAFGELLTLAAREADTVARVGGDEFALLLAPFHGSDSLKSAVNRYQSELCGTCSIDGVQMAVTGSVGGAVCPTDGTELAQILAIADQRMYAA